jgi:hypothetical protein
MTQPDAREGQAGRCGETEGFVVPRKPANAGGGKGPQFKTNARRSEGPGDWATYQLRRVFRNCRRICPTYRHRATSRTLPDLPVVVHRRERRPIPTIVCARPVRMTEDVGHNRTKLGPTHAAGPMPDPMRLRSRQALLNSPEPSFMRPPVCNPVAIGVVLRIATTITASLVYLAHQNNLKLTKPRWSI